MEVKFNAKKKKIFSNIQSVLMHFLWNVKAAFGGGGGGGGKIYHASGNICSMRTYLFWDFYAVLYATTKNIVCFDVSPCSLLEMY
jgi:hypothetical protein